MNREVSVALPPATRVRYGVLGFACALSMVTYLDRVCFAQAIGDIVKVLGLDSEADLKWALGGFTFAYAAFEVPSGWLGDVYGPRRTLIRIVLWWSLFTALTGLVGLEIAGSVLVGVVMLSVIRFLFGMGEAGAYPNITRALHNWFPFVDRGLAQGAVWMSGRLMGGLTPLIWWLLISQLGLSWRGTFWVFGLFGVTWCVFFALWFRNRPEEKPEVNEAELQMIRAGRHDTEAGHKHVPWGSLLTSPNLWAVCLMYFCASYGWYFNITYLPRFLEQQYGVSPTSSLGAIYKGGPLWLGAVACLAGGFLTDLFIRRTGNRKWGRRLFGITGHGLCALCYVACLAAPSAFTFFLSISMAAFWNDMTMGSAWAVCQDIGKRYAAIVAGCMNTVGNLGGFAANIATGFILEHTLSRHAASLGLAVNQLDPAEKAAGLLPGYQFNLVTFGIVYLLAALLWLRIDATKAVVPDVQLPPELPEDQPPIVDERIQAPQDHIKPPDDRFQTGR
jgi:MFS family permease